MKTHYEMVPQNLLEQTNFTVEELKATALRNLIRKVNVSCNVFDEDRFCQDAPEFKPFYRVHFDNDLNASIFLLDEFWDSKAQEIANSDRIAVSMPAKNLIYFSDMHLRSSFMAMRIVGTQLFETLLKDGIALTGKTYIRENGKWILHS